MKKKELVKVLLDFFHVNQNETLPLKYIFERLKFTTHPQKMLCMDVLDELKEDDYICETDKHKYRLNNHGVEMTGTFWFRATFFTSSMLAAIRLSVGT